ncbi:monovalent cation/H+ antiporter complex subunit F [Nocardioides yefusunii]|uniref:Monovalent cation/H+ antiporter complex subunit F n=1 Tax=Nocardioides yefusunii TaxID=2500546 RepID=A0ABW1QYX6_9ACTN|nr:monovalent cation/H+ antiporter complex subunit F [Nocardioides yefusunii]
MTWVLLASAVMLSAAALLLVFRITVGPTILDRSMALDVMMSVMVCAVALKSIWREDAWSIPMLLVLASVGFVGAVSIARYASGADDDEARDDDSDDSEDEARA